MNVHTSMAITIIQRITISGWSSFADKKKKKQCQGGELAQHTYFNRILIQNKSTLFLGCFQVIVHLNRLSGLNLSL